MTSADQKRTRHFMLRGSHGKLKPHAIWHPRQGPAQPSLHTWAGHHARLLASSSWVERCWKGACWRKARTVTRPYG